MVNGLTDLAKSCFDESCAYDEIVARQQAMVMVLNIYKNKDVLASIKLLCGMNYLAAQLNLPHAF